MGMDKRSIVFLLSVSAAFFLIHMWYGPQPRVYQEPLKEEAIAPAPPLAPPTDASYYVLENDYQQLVFSTAGGSIVEINLPFRDQRFPNSVVFPVEADRKIREQSPKDALFPAVPARRSDGSVLEPALGGYYPLLRRFQESFCGGPCGPCPHLPVCRVRLPCLSRILFHAHVDHL